jgi:5-deoxy-glucuronate isomerase
MQWFFRDGELAKDGWNVVVDGNVEGWQHTGLRVGDLTSGVQFHIAADDVERIIYLIHGIGLQVSYRTDGDSEYSTQSLGGRKSPFDGTTDMIYLPMGTEILLEGEGRVLVGEAAAREVKPVKFIPADTVPVFVRGAGRESRQVHNFGVPEELDASRFIVVEVLVPSGNWSGIPAHKHDTYIPGVESNLEEIYYFETRVVGGQDQPVADPTGYMRGYASDEREYDVTCEVRSGDVALVPWGWHGPVAATPGADLYFFNVMAGPDPDRSWNITDDPNQAWLRESWHHQDPDPRLPFSAQ